MLLVEDQYGLCNYGHYDENVHSIINVYGTLKSKMRQNSTFDSLHLKFRILYVKGDNISKK